MIKIKIGLSVLTLIVIVFGAYVRLTDAGLGCPDWPGCYGKLIPNASGSEEIFDNSFDLGKAWREMIHRYLAGLLGLGIFGVVFHTLRQKRKRGFPVLEISLIPLVLIQSILGMFTVTLLLKPLVVTLHLMGGLIILSILWWSLLEDLARGQYVDSPRSLKIFGLLGFLVLIIQIFLGGWTSTNYAALACTDFPTCQGMLFPSMHWREAFTLWRGIGMDYEYGVLDSGARATIHYMHRLWAFLSTGIILFLVVWSFVQGRLEIKWVSFFMGCALITQVVLGISNILLGLPLVVAVAHNGVAAILVLTMVTFLFLTVRCGSFQNGSR